MSDQEFGREVLALIERSGRAVGIIAFEQRNGWLYCKQFSGALGCPPNHWQYRPPQASQEDPQDMAAAARK